MYEESETWAIWPNNVDLSEFNDTSGVVIAVIFHQLFDGVRQRMDDLKTKMFDEKSLLTVKMNELLAWFEEYRTEVQINDDFARYFVASHRAAFFFSYRLST